MGLALPFPTYLASPRAAKTHEEYVVSLTILFIGLFLYILTAVYEGLGHGTGSGLTSFYYEVVGGTGSSMILVGAIFAWVRHAELRRLKSATLIFAPWPATVPPPPPPPPPPPAAVFPQPRG
ncbi:MAG: hypothetical protein KGI98_03730 [Euryarchaeota archaeon]|nr:hypothetical protein [Euryarchaeota archaeon]MDE1880626.1 hypothetical protein [Euryarchaeota archaeon]